MLSGKSIQHIPFKRGFATIILIVMSIQLVAIEGFGISPIKITLMGLCSLYFVFHLPITKATWACLLYWIVCYTTSLLHGSVRFSTLGYLGLFLITYTVYYYLIYSKVLTLIQFKQILKFILLAYCIVLILQQVFFIIGIKDFALLNLAGNTLGGNIYYLWNRLPSLSCEPSHTARVISAAMLGYIRCLEIEQNSTITIKVLFNKNNRLVTFSYLWLVSTMGSGTGWIGLAILCLYFIRIRSILYIGPFFICLGILLYNAENKQFLRAINAAQATMTGDIMKITEADQSGSVRIVPLVNTLLFTDLFQKDSWIGKGTLSEDETEDAWKDLTRKVSVVEQYGLLGLLASLILLYSCAIYHFFSIESLLFVFLLLLSLNNIYVVWSMIFIFTTIRYFQIQQKTKPLRL